MKLYTRTGDDGKTGLFGGGRVPKDHPRVEAYGSVDELNACIGWTIAAIQHGGPKPGQSEAPARVNAEHSGDFHLSLRHILTTLQSRLFDLGADLATPSDSKHEDKISRINADHVAAAERWIDEIDAKNSPITVFILPGGTELASRLHMARTICRRAERAMVRLSEHDAVNPQAIVLINRISDLLFAMARRANKEAEVSDVAWERD